MKRSDAIKLFLKSSKHPVASFYTSEMEVQVNVDPIGGDRNGNSWTDGNESWYHFRIPKDANKEPVDTNQTELNFNFTNRVFAIGLTGWNFITKKSIWVGFDFDSLVGHKKGLTNEQLNTIIDKFKQLPSAFIVRSKSGNGYHIYIFLDNVNNINNHIEHSQVAKAVLDQLNGILGLDLNNSVDVYGGILWIWHKEQSTNAWEIVKTNTELFKISNYLNNVDRTKRSLSNYSLDNYFSNDASDLESDHQRLIQWLQSRGYSWRWESQKRLLVCHTYNLKEAHNELGFKGMFDTIASGESGAIQGTDWNCFCVPIDNGAWIVRRFGVGTTEHESWSVDDKGYAICFYNSFPSLSNLGLRLDAVNIGDQAFSFSSSEKARECIIQLGGALDLPIQFCHRAITIKQIIGDRLLVSVLKEKEDGNIEGWATKTKYWIKIIELPKGSTTNKIQVPHNLVRHLVSGHSDSGWVINTGNNWITEPRKNVEDFLLSHSYTKNIIDLIIGKCIQQHWTIVNEPFQLEYLGMRRWNKHACQFAVEPREGEHSTWDMIFNHLGQSLDLYIQENQWCQLNNITTGAGYLKLWCAWLLQRPKESLPYLFFYSKEQNTGKSTFHEALRYIFKNGSGYIRADRALTNTTGFNGELETAILCVVEETSLSKVESLAYSRIKDWVTAPIISIRHMRKASYDTINTTHWVQCSNSIRDCPILPGDTRITAIAVPPIINMIGRSDFFAKLERQLPAFLFATLNMPLPPREGRLNIPVISTGEKQDEAESKLNEVEIFIRDCCYSVPGAMVSFSDFYEVFSKQYDVSKIAVGRMLPSEYPKGRVGSLGQWFIGNLSLEPCESKKKLQRVGDRLR